MKVAAVQLTDIQGDVGASLEITANTLQDADGQGIDLVCFPECFLQGYTLDETETKERAIALDSPQFTDILTHLAPYKAAAIIGLIERENDAFYNTAVVLQHGTLLGKYRKVHLFETNFVAGTEQPVFTVNMLTFGINICYDARFSEGAAQLARKGADVIFYPLNNRLPHEKAEKYRDKHIPNLIARAQETGCWVVSADVVGKDATHTGYGCTAIVDPTGRVVSQVDELMAGVCVAELTREAL